MEGPDPNWLLSTAAQSAAAIVGLIGGFIASRVLGLHAERNGVGGRITETEARLQIARRERDALRQCVVDHDAPDFLRNALKEIALSRGAVSLQRLMEKFDTMGLTEKELRPFYDEGVRDTLAAFKLFEEKFPFQTAPPKSMQGYLQRVGFEVAEEKLSTYSQVYEILADEYRRRQTHGTAVFVVPVDLSNLYIPPNPVYEAEAMRSYDQLVRDTELAEREVERLETEGRELVARLNSLRTPKQMAWGVWVLVLFSASGVGFPLALLPIDSAAFTPLLRWSVIGAFGFGFAAVLAFLVVSLRQLSR